MIWISGDLIKIGVKQVTWSDDDDRDVETNVEQK